MPEIKPIDPNAGRPGMPVGYYNEDSEDHGERYHSAERALIVRPKWKSVVGFTIIGVVMTMVVTAAVAKWSGHDLPTLRDISISLTGKDYAGDYQPITRNDIIDKILSYIPEWIPHAY